MADTIKEAQVKITASDQTKAGTDSVKRNLKGVGKAAQQTQQKMQGFVSEQTGRNLSQFNEKTEKGRQLLTAFGGAVGGAAGSVVFYAGSISYVIGRFSLLELGVMAGIAAIGGLAWAISSSLPDIESLGDRIERTAKSTGDLVKSTNEYILAQTDVLAGTDETRKRTRQLRLEMVDQEGVLGRLMERAGKFQTLIGEGNFLHNLMYRGDLKDLAREISLVTGRINEISSAITGLAAAKAAAAAAADLPPIIVIRWETGREIRARIKAQWKMFFDEAVALAASGDMPDAFASMDAKRAEDDEARALLVRNRKYKHFREDLALEAEINERRFQAEEEAAAHLSDIQVEAMEKKMEIMAMAADASVSIAMAIAQGEASAVLKSMAVQAVAKAAYHGIMAIASALWQRYDEAAKHGAMAAKWAGFAAAYGAGYGIASAAGGGGGGGASYGAGTQARGTTPTGNENQEPTTKVIYYVNGHMINTKPEYDRVFSDGVQGYQESQDPGREYGSF